MEKRSGPTVVLFHGILVTERAMRPLERFAIDSTGTAVLLKMAVGLTSTGRFRRHIAKKTGLRALSLTYHTRGVTLAQSAKKLAAEIRELHPEERRPEVFAVACSLGSVLLRHIVALPDGGGIEWKGSVLIAPPSRGSMVARRIAKVPLLGWIVGLVLGRAGRELGEEIADGRDWSPPPQPCGVIAGTKAVTLLNPVGWVSNLFRLIDRPNDGTIAASEAQLPQGQMADFRTVAAGHTRIQNHPEVQRLTVNFILHQSFARSHSQTT